MIKQKAIQEFDTYGERDLKYFGLKIEKAEMGVNYDYSHDHQWNSITEQINSLKDRLKARETLLKSVPVADSLKGIKPMTELDDETGEVYELRPPIKTSTTSLKMTFAK